MLKPLWPLWAILALAAVLLVSWAFVVPVFESPDEPHHWINAEYIHDHWSLPPYDTTYAEGNQAPLYYTLMAPFAEQSATPPRSATIVNGKVELSCWPRFFRNCPGDSDRYWPIRRARLATVVLSLMGVFFSGLAALELTGNLTAATLAAALIGFLPQFTFRGASVNNDAGVVSVSALALYLITRLAARGFDRRTAMYSSLAVGLACLCKVNAVALLPAMVLTVVSVTEGLGARVYRVVGMLSITGMVLLPWCVRNFVRYGDFLAKDVMPSTVPALVVRQSLTSPYFRTTFPELTWRSLIGYFGWMNIKLPEPIYDVYKAILILALAGVVVAWYRTGRKRLALLALASVPVTSFVVLIYFNLTFSQPQGRLLFPCLSALAVLLAAGIIALPRVAKPAAYAVMAFAFASNVYAAVKVIYPAYWHATETVPLLDASVPDTLMKGTPPGPLDPGHEFAQTFTAQHNGLSAVEVEVTAYGKRIPSGTFRLALSDRTGDIATIHLPASMIPNCCIYARLSFPAIEHSSGNVYRIGLTTQGIPSGDAITVFLSGTDIYSGGEFTVDGRDTHQDTSFRAYYNSGDADCLSCGTSGR